MSITDLHICKDAPESQSGSNLDICNCPPEYSCIEVCGEGYSLSTLISWQHFPRSTSSRSRCQSSSEEHIKSITGTPTLPEKEEETEGTKPSTTEYPITKSFSQLKALHYLEIRHVFEFLNFLIGHLVCNEPEDPVTFLVDILGKCIKYRDSFGEPPLLFTHSHIKSLYTAFDPFERGHVTMDQYREAMRTLGLANGITPYNQEPPVNEEGYVEENSFVFEAERCLNENLRQMLRIPKIWEENRLLWKKKMMKKLKTKLPEKETEYEGEYLEEKPEEKGCKCGSPIVMTNVVCRCSSPSEPVFEPEQLFLNNLIIP